MGLSLENVVLIFNRDDPRLKRRDEVGENFHAVGKCSQSHPGRQKKLHSMMLIQGKNWTSPGFEVFLMVSMNITVMPYSQVAGCAPTAPIVLHGVTSWRAAVCVCVCVAHEFRGKFGSPFGIVTSEVILFCVYLYLFHINFTPCQFCIYLPSLLNMGICKNLFFQWKGHNELVVAVVVVIIIR